MELFDIKSVYDFEYPKLFLKIVELNLTDLECWVFSDKDDVEWRINGLIKRYPNRKLVPFARRFDCDDIACFEIGKGEEVQIIHDFASSGWEQVSVYENFESWFREAVNEMLLFLKSEVIE